VSQAQILAYAARHAPAFTIARSRLTLGDAELTAAKPLLPDDPEVSLSAGPRFSGGGQALDLEVSIQQQIQLSGERGLRIEAATRTRRRLEAELARVRWRVHRRVHAAYHIAQVARQRSKAAERRLTFAEQLLSIAKRREKAGAISGLQVQVAKGEVAQARQARIAQDNAYRTACLTLAELSGWPAHHPPQPAGPLDTPRAPPPTNRLLKLAQTYHPTLRTLAASIRETQAWVRLADRKAVPKPALGVVYAREGDASGAATNIVRGTLSLPIPIWQRNQGERAKARSRLTIARARFEAFKNILRSQVTRAAAAVSASARRIAVYGSKVIPTFERNLTMIRRAFEAGKIDVLQVMVARSRFLEIQRQSLDAHEDYFRAAATLESVVGAEVWTKAAGQRAKP